MQNFYILYFFKYTKCFHSKLEENGLYLREKLEISYQHSSSSLKLMSLFLTE